MLKVDYFLKSSLSGKIGNQNNLDKKKTIEATPIKNNLWTHSHRHQKNYFERIASKMQCRQMKFTCTSA